MQKAKVICIILAIVLVSTGTVLLIDNLSSSAIEITRPNDTISAVMDRPEDGVFNQDNAKENLYIAHGELIRAGGFKGQNKGTSSSFGITQTVWSDRTVVGNNVFKQSVSDGLVKMGSQTYIWGENYVFRGMEEVKAVDNVVWQNTAKRVSKQTYEETYGYRFSELTGYILNDNTITNAYFESCENGVYKYRYVLDCETAPYFVLYEMRTNAGTKGFGTFTQAEIIVEMDGDWQIKTLTTDCKYKVPMLGGVECEEHMTEVFYDIGYNGDLPNKDFFEPYLTAEIETPAKKEPDALSALLEMFEPHLAKGKLNAELAISNKGEALANLKLSLGIDIANLSNITADVLLGDSLYISYEQGELFATYGDFKGKTTVNGVMGLVSSLMPKGDSDNNAFADINFDELLSGATFAQTNGGCEVELPIKLGDLQINAVFNGVKNGDGYDFANATVTLGDIAIDIVLCNAFEVPEHTEEYPEILGLLDIVKNGVISVDVNVNGIAANVAYDMEKGKLWANVGDLQAVMQNGTIYATLGEINLKASFDEIKTLIAVFGDLLGGSLPVTELPQINVNAADILAILSSVTTETVENGVAFDLSLGDINLQLVLTAQDGKWNIGAINLTYGELQASVTPNDCEVTFPQIDETKFVSAVEVVNTYLAPVQNLLSAKNFGVNLNLALNVNGTQIGVLGNLVYDENGNVSVDAQIALNDNRFITANVIYADKALYVSVNGVKVALPLDNMGGSVSAEQIKQVVSQIYGKNEALDTVIDQVYAVAENFANFDISKLNVAELVSAFAFENGKLTVGINANQFGLGEFTVSIEATDNLTLALTDLVLGSVIVNDANASVTTNVQAVAVPDEDYTTNLKIVVDELNTIYANLDLINGEYRLRLDNLNVLYKDGTIRINYNDDLLIKTNLAEMQNIIAKFNAIAGDNAQFGEDGISLGSFDLQALLATLTFVCDGAKAQIGATLMGLDVTLNIFNGEFEAVLPIVAINKVFVITADEKRDYCEFTDDETAYVAIEDIINDYFPTLEKLAKTKSWHFDINAEVTVTDEQNVATQYLLSNSYVEFVYDKVNNVFELRAKMDIKKQANGEWVDFKVIELAYFNNRVFVNYNGLKITLSLNALLTCLTNDTSLSIKEALEKFIEKPGENGTLVDELVTVIPQIKDAILKYNEAKNQITDTVATVNYSSILKKATYVNGVFELVIDGGIFVDGLGDVKLAFGHNGEALSLTDLELTYGNVSVNGVSIDVTALDEQSSLEFIESYPYYFETDAVPSSNLGIETDEAKQSAKTAAYHINLDSIKQLLSAFVVTATDRSFSISGEVHVVMLGIVDAKINLGVKVDITENNDVFISAKIDRPKQSVIDLKNLVYDDYGGTSYLFYDSTTGLFNVIRNSYRKSGLLGVKMNENDYRETDIPTEVFSADVVGYLLKMINFSKSINDKILGSINGDEGSNEWGIEEVIKDYYYTSASKQFAAKVDLKPISSSLGEATLKINHNDNYQLTSLNVQMNLISICNLTMDLNLNEAVVGDATSLVNELRFW